MEATLERKLNEEAPKDIQFSWKSVYRRWIQNMKDDIDPALNGAKMAAYSMHGWSTWIREHDEGKLAVRHPCVTYTSAALTLGAQLGAYYGAFKLVNAVTTPISVSGNEVDLGYAVAGIPILANAVSWSCEAFKRAKKSELERVVMTKTHRALDTLSSAYDLSNNALLEQISTVLYNGAEEERTNRRSALETYCAKYVKGGNETPEEQQVPMTHEMIKKLLDNRPRFERDQLDYAQANRDYQLCFEVTKEELQADARTNARTAIAAFTKDVFDGLIAEEQLGKPYEATSAFHVGSSARKFQNGAMKEDDYDKVKPCVDMVIEHIGKAVHDRGGNANVELLGQITEVYNASDPKGISYRVTPSVHWNT